MKKITFLLLLIVASFCSGFAVNAALTEHATHALEPKRVTGIGGIFFKCKDAAKVRAWYKEHLGLATNQYGAVFEWRQGADTLKKGFTQWSTFGEKTTYFEPSTKDFMINYRVENLDRLLQQLKTEGVNILDKVEVADYGKFVHIMDIGGNKIELWEPNDMEYEKLGIKMGSQTTK